jgi:hypothetical protein
LELAAILAQYLSTYIGKKTRGSFVIFTRLPAARLPYITDGLCAEGKADVQIESPKVPLIILAMNY